MFLAHHVDVEPLDPIKRPDWQESQESLPPPWEEQIRRSMLPGSSSPPPVKGVKNYVWQNLETAGVIASLSAPVDSTTVPMVLFKKDSGYYVAWRRPTASGYKQFRLMEDPSKLFETKEELLGALRKIFLEYEVHLSTPSPHEVKKIKRVSEHILLIPTLDMSNIAERAEHLVHLLEANAFLPIDRHSVKNQLMQSLIYIEVHREDLIEKAKLSGGACYIRPSLQGFNKVGLHKLGARYLACHIYFCEDGRAFLIPKHWGLVAGTGNFKVVRLAIEAERGKIVAAASVRTHSEIFKREVHLVKSFLPETLKALIYTNSKVTKGKLILPFAKYGSLDTAMNNPSFPLHGQKKKIMELVVEQVQQIHDKGIICHDIKGPNILFGEEYGEPAVWILDLGLAKWTEESQKEDMGRGTRYAIAPEGFKLIAHLKQGLSTSGIEDSKEKTDIFALGILLLDILKNRTDDNWHSKDYDPLPWFHKEDQRRFFQGDIGVEVTYQTLFKEYGILHPKWKLPKTIDESFTPETIEQAIAWATHWDPQQRPTAEKLLKALKELSF